MNTISSTHTPDTRKALGIDSPNGQKVNAGIDFTRMQILDLIHEDEKQVFQENILLFLSRVESLKVAIEEKRAQMNYDYHDYEQRLSASDDLLFETFLTLISTDPHLKAYVKSITDFAPTQREKSIVLQRLMEEYFEDVVYENLTGKVSQETKQDYGYGILHFAILSDFDGLCESLQSLKSVGFTNVDFGKFRLSTLDTLCGNLTQVRSMDLDENSLEIFEPQRLKILFQPLRNLKHLNLYNNTLGLLDHERLQIIFHSLVRLKSLELGECELYRLDETGLLIIAECLNHLHSLNLEENLDKCSHSQLHILFSNLTRCVRLDLKRNPLQFLDYSELDLIFTPLKHLKKILIVEPDDFYKLLLSRYGFLEGILCNNL